MHEKKENLPSLLNHEEIKNLNLIEDFNEDNFGEASYVVRAGILLNCLGNEVIKFPYRLQPQGMISTVTTEQFNFGKHCVYGYTTVRNTLSREGIMGLNIGLIDPGYAGPIGVILVNFGKKAFLIHKNDPIMRVTFHSYNKPVSRKDHIIESKTRSDYIARKAIEAMNLPEAFLNLDKTFDDIDKRVDKGITKRLIEYAQIGFIVATIAFLVSLFLKNYGDQTLVIKRLDNIEAQNKLLLEKGERPKQTIRSSEKNLAK